MPLQSSDSLIVAKENPDRKKTKQKQKKQKKTKKNKEKPLWQKKNNTSMQCHETNQNWWELLW